jgi:hypothetical protein
MLDVSISNSPMSIEKMLFNLTIIEMLISLYWLVNGLFFTNVEIIMNNCIPCFISSIISVFIQNFDWLFFTFSLHNLLVFVTDPFKEREFTKRLKWYYIISFIVSGLFTYCVLATQIYGISVIIEYINLADVNLLY